jgi:hypothetical protein
MVYQVIFGNPDLNRIPCFYLFQIRKNLNGLPNQLQGIIKIVILQVYRDVMRIGILLFSCYVCFALPGKAQHILSANNRETPGAATSASPIAKPCGLAHSAPEKAIHFAGTADFTKAMSLLLENVAVAPLQEHIVAFGKDSSGQVLLSAVSTGSLSSSLVPEVAKAFADLHNHPKNTPPSSGDLYGLLEKARRSPDYNSRFVITSSGRLYALVVTDTIAATAFLNTYPPQRLKGFSPLFPDDLLNEFREIKFLHGAAEELAMAWMLEKYHIGVVLLKKERFGAFEQIRTRLVKEGTDLRYVADNCR